MENINVTKQVESFIQDHFSVNVTPFALADARVCIGRDYSILGVPIKHVGGQSLLHKVKTLSGKTMNGDEAVLRGRRRLLGAGQRG